MYLSNFRRQCFGKASQKRIKQFCLVLFQRQKHLDTIPTLRRSDAEGKQKLRVAPLIFAITECCQNTQEGEEEGGGKKKNSNATFCKLR